MPVNKKVSKKNIDMYNCKSYYNDDNKLVDCTCGNCWEETKLAKKATKGTVKLPVSKSMQNYLDSKLNDVQGRDMTLDEIGVDNDPGIDVPPHLRGGEFNWNFEKKTPIIDKILWVLAVVEVAILISLVIKNV